MGQIDFIMAMLVIIAIVSFSIFYVSGNFTNQLEEMSVLELRQTSKILEKIMFDDLLQEDMKLMKASFEETDGSSHTETIILTFTGTADDLNIYTDEMNHVIAAVGNEITFDISIGANEIKYYNIIYSGTVSGVSYNNAENITASILSEQDYLVVSEQACFDLDYDEFREDFYHNFRIKIGSCELGLDPPEATVVARNVPIVLNTGIVQKEFANILVW